MNYQKKITEIENAQKALTELKKEVLISERKSKKLVNPENSLPQTKKNSLAVYRQIFKLDVAFINTKRIINKI